MVVERVAPAPVALCDPRLVEEVTDDIATVSTWWLEGGPDETRFVFDVWSDTPRPIADRRLTCRLCSGLPVPGQRLCSDHRACPPTLEDTFSQLPEAERASNSFASEFSSHDGERRLHGS